MKDPIQIVAIEKYLEFIAFTKEQVHKLLVRSQAMGIGTSQNIFEAELHLQSAWVHVSKILKNMKEED